MKTLFAMLLMAGLLAGGGARAQKTTTQSSTAGALVLGVRTSFSLVNDGSWLQPATGTGGHFRLRFSPKVDSEWFLDYLTAGLGKTGSRTDVHIGWSMMVYLLRNPEPLLQPYVLAGHCFEYLGVEAGSPSYQKAKRYSASVQAGLGMHFNISQRWCVSLQSQYMLHFGTKIRVMPGPEGITLLKEKGSGMADHLLFNLSVNYKIADLW